MYQVYILHSQKLNRYYVGFTNDLQRRLAEHNRKKGKYTDAGIPWELVYTENYSTRQSAMKRERFIKSRKSRNFIEHLIEGEG